MHPFLLAFAVLSLAACPTLWEYRSKSPDVLDRYSAGYASFLVLHLAGTAVLTLLAVNRRSRAALGIARLESAAAHVFKGGLALASALLVFWGIFLALAFAACRGAFGHSWTLHIAGALGVLCLSLWLLTRARSTPRSQARAIGKYLIGFGTILGLLVVLEILLRTHPALLAVGVIEALPEKGDVFFNFYDFDDEITVGYRYKPGIQFSQQLRASSAYAYQTFRGVVSPLAPEGDEVLREASFRSDSIGYRNEEPLRDHYPIVVSGDSFTSHSVEPHPWPSLMAARTGQAVLNLGLQGYGPQNEVEAILRFGLEKQPKQIVLGYYEGNDLLDAEGYERRKRAGRGWREAAWAKLPILDRHLSAHLIRYSVSRAFETEPEKESPADAKEYPYPFAATLSGREVKLGFADTYLSLLSLPRCDVERLKGFEATMKAIVRLQAACEERGVDLLVAYFPTKEHCYIPVLPPQVVARKLGKAVAPGISPEGEFLLDSPSPAPLAAEPLLENIDCQRQCVLETLARRGVRTVDLTLRLQDGARRGEQLYWPLDNHWTPAGHELAAAVITESLTTSR